jgi:hypothetical protein
MELVATADAVAFDSRGAPTIVGLNQRFFPVGLAPPAVKLTVLVVVTDGDDPGPTFPECLVNVRIRRDTGEVRFAFTHQLRMAPKIWPELPAFVHAPLDVIMVPDRTGRQDIEVELVHEGTVVDSATRSLYVVPYRQPPEAVITTAAPKRSARAPAASSSPAGGAAAPRARSKGTAKARGEVQAAQVDGRPTEEKRATRTGRARRSAS